MYHGYRTVWQALGTLTVDNIIKSEPPLRAPDSAVPTTPPSNVTAAPGLGLARERAGACQAPDPRRC
eukprot:scaffold10220_cov144-Isochrysis_galbana.AAC.7